MQSCNRNGYCAVHNSWLCGHEEDKEEFKRHMDAFDQAMDRLKKYNHGRCDIYHTGDRVYFICTKPV